jgi:hypothetical protein
MKKPSISTIIAFLVILLAVLGLVMLKTPKEINAPSDNVENVINNQESENSEQTTENDQVNVEAQGDVSTPTPQFIYGDGFVAEITPVLDVDVVLPVIKKFELASNDGSVCRFSWEVEEARSCDFVNITTMMQVESAGTKSSVQTADKGDFQLNCYGNAGGVIKSEVLSCK